MDDFEDMDEMDAAAVERGLLYEAFLNIKDEQRFYERHGGVMHARAIAPNEIKSATDNRGTFDGREADMTLSVTDAQEQGLFEDGVMEAANVVVVSAYSSDSTEKYKALLKGGYLRYADKERALMWAGAEGDSILQLLTTALHHSGSEVMLKENMPSVNTDFTSSVLNLDERALSKIKDMQKQGRLVYSKYTIQEMEEAINKQAIPPTAEAPGTFKTDLMRAAVKDGLPPTVPTKEDSVKHKDENFDFFGSMVTTDEQAPADEVVEAGQGFRAKKIPRIWKDARGRCSLPGQQKISY